MKKIDEWEQLFSLLGIEHSNVRIKVVYPYNEEVNELLKRFYFEDEDLFEEY